MGLRDLIKKKEDLSDGAAHDPHMVNRVAGGPEFTFIRSDTMGQEEILPPSGPPSAESTFLQPRDPFSDANINLNPKQNGGGGGLGVKRSVSTSRLSLDVFKSRSRSASASGAPGGPAPHQHREGRARRLSQRLHLSRSPVSSEHVPQDLPDIQDDGAEEGGAEAQWERRATMLAGASPSPSPSRPPTPPSARRGGSIRSPGPPLASPGGGGSVTRKDSANGGGGGGGGSGGVVSSKAIDDDIQEAIRLHEEGDLERSTALFGRLADPHGANNPLSQVLYGLALRHGWGCTPEPERAVTFLSAAASNSAVIESLALQAGLKKGGAAKGELVLAIFELANCFRHGWGIHEDKIAAKQYYETAANLGDTDAMNEVAWCYLQGFGCKKDKFAAAKYYRLAEQNGNKTLGNSWIWKDKYNPPEAGGGKK